LRWSQGLQLVVNRYFVSTETAGKSRVIA